MRRALRQLALYCLLDCCYTQTNLPFKMAVFKFMTAYAVRTRRSVPLERLYLSTRPHGVKFFITNHPRSKLENTHTRSYMLWFQFKRSVVLLLDISLPCVVAVYNKLASSVVLMSSFSTNIIVVLFHVQKDSCFKAVERGYKR
jgi:hypothetical protein